MLEKTWPDFENTSTLRFMPHDFGAESFKQLGQRAIERNGGFALKVRSSRT